MTTPTEIVSCEKCRTKIQIQRPVTLNCPNCDFKLVFHARVENSDLPPLTQINGGFATALAENKARKAAEKADPSLRKSCVQVVAERERHQELYNKLGGRHVRIKETKQEGVVVGVDSCPQKYVGAPHPPVGDYLVINVGGDHVTALESQIEEVF